MNSLIDEYRSEAKRHGHGLEEGNSQRANAAHDRLVEIATILINSDSANTLLSLFCDDNAWVQLCAATHALEIDEAKSLKKLEEISVAGIPLTRMCAKYTIQSWKKGELKRVKLKNSTT